MLTKLVFYSHRCFNGYLLVFLLIFGLFLLLEGHFGIIQKTLQFIKALSVNKFSLPAFLLLAFLGLVYIVVIVYQKYPLNTDEFDYLFQAKTFLKGRWFNPAPLHNFDFFGIVHSNDKWFSRYPPGWPFALCLGLFFHIPSWIVNPIVSTVSLWVLYLLGNLLYSRAVVLAAIIFIISSPFFLFNGASYFAHPFCALCILLSAYCCYKLLLKPETSPEILCWAGVWAGWAFLTRYYTALIIVPVLIEMMVKRKGIFFKKDLGYFLLGVLPFVIMYFLYNFQLTGNLLLTPFQALSPEDHARLNMSLAVKHLYILWDQQYWMSSSLFLFYFCVMLARFKSKGFYWIESAFLILIISSHVFYPLLIEGYGDRYLYEGYFFGVLAVFSYLSQNMMQFQTSWFKRAILLSLIVGFIMNILIFPAIAGWNYWLSNSYLTLTRLVAQRHLTHAIVLIPSHQQSKEYFTLTRNDPDLQGDVLYAYDVNIEELRKNFPDRRFYRFFPHQGIIGHSL